MNTSATTVNPVKIAGLLLGIAGFILPLFISLPGLSFAGHLTLGIFILAAFFWMLEPIPIHATSLLVIFLGILLLSGQGPMYKGKSISFVQPVASESGQWQLPASSVTPQNTVWVKTGTVWSQVSVEIVQVAGETVTVTGELIAADQVPEQAGNSLVGYNPGRYNDYMGTLANPIIILFLGGFMIAEAAVKYNFDKNLTRFLLKPFGTRPGPILLGLMAVTATLSAFMSNTATTAMMMTVIIPIMAQMKKGDLFKTALALSIPIAANIGGMATPIGTPPNAVVIAALQKQNIAISFSEWMALTLPLVLIILGLAWFMLVRLFPPAIENFNINRDAKFDKSGNAMVFYGIFAVTLVLWVTESLHGISSNIVAFLPIAGLTLTNALSVNDIRKLPWEVLWLVAGGLALGLYMDQTGLATYLVGSISWQTFSGFAVIAMFALVAVVMSNFLSNTVTATLLMPLAVGIGVLQGSGTIEMIELALVIGVGTSLAMVLPISTPPNAIAMATGMVKTSEMAKTGLIIGVVGISLMLVYSVIYWPLLLK
jgi:sodium-dependent dicarboxylate transporter 2/3/5